MLKILKIAVRNLARFHRRTLLTSALITLGIVSVLSFVSIAGSFKAMMIGQFTDSVLGHLEVHRRGYVASIDNLPLNLNMPAGNPPPPTQEPVVVTIDIDFDGTILWNGEQLPTREALQGKLVQAAAQPDQPEVHVRPNKLVEYRYVAEVLAESQRLGVTKLGMVGNEQFVK
jgi:biopolymer transport protein ExbD